MIQKEANVRMNIAEFGIVCFELAQNFRAYELDENQICESLQRLSGLVDDYDESAETKSFKPKVIWEESS